MIFAGAQSLRDDSSTSPVVIGKQMAARSALTGAERRMLSEQTPLHPALTG